MNLRKSGARKRRTCLQMRRQRAPIDHNKMFPILLPRSDPRFGFNSMASPML